ncbi:MAG TPA: DUF58 domain-containing protein [Nocardioides sp.]|nr:DUF58 domain-containing protein [Nocardioides sp.]
MPDTPPLPPPRPGLTLRGRAFCAAGLAIVVSAILLGQSGLLRIGALMLALPVLSWLLIRTRRLEVSARRLLAQPVVPAGSACHVDLVVTATVSGTLLVEEQVPYALGGRPRFVLRRTEAEQHARYTVRSDVRGRFTVGPLVTRVTDPFSLVERRQVVPGTASIIVTPRIVALPAITLGGGRTGTGERSLPHIAAGSAEDVTVREYRRGDDLRRVHWRSSARVGELMVRREEHPWEARATVLLDNRAGAHGGRGPSSSLEMAVVIAASVLVHLDARGFAVRLVTADGPLGGDVEPVSLSLERLAVLGLSWREDLETRWSSDAGKVGTIIGVLGTLNAHDTGGLRRLRHNATQASALVLDAGGSHARVEEASGPLDTLRSLGWRVAPVGRTSKIEQAWRELDIAARPR